MSRLRALVYSIRRGLAGMVQAPLVQLLAIATTAVCMTLLGGVMLVWVNAQQVSQAWGIDVPVVVYLHDDTPKTEIDELQRRLDALPEIAATQLVEPHQAMSRLAEGLAGEANLLEGIEPDVLPTSLEIRLHDEVPAAFANALADKLGEFPAVDEVAVAREWVEQVEALLSTLKSLALGAAALVALACIAIVWSTIRLAVYARRAEIQILRLVGGTARFVRGPFLVEGSFQGALGALLAFGIIFVGFDAISPFIEGGLSMVFAGGALRFFEPHELGVGLAFGALLGFAGSRAAVGRTIEV